MVVFVRNAAERQEEDFQGDGLRLGLSTGISIHIPESTLRDRGLVCECSSQSDSRLQFRRQFRMSTICERMR